MANVARRRISFVSPCFNEEETLPLLRDALSAVFDRLAPDYDVEAILVDDGSRDRTWSRIREYAEKDPRFKGVALSRNFGHQAALSCGYDWASGDAIISIDGDLQDPPELVLQMIEKWEDGADVVYAVRDSRAGESAFKRATASLFYRLVRALGAGHVRADAGDFRLLSRRSLDALRSLPEYHRFLRGMVGWLGFRTAEVHYARRPRRAGVTKYTLGKMVRFATDAVVSFSILPLRLAYVGGALLSLGVLGYLGYALMQYLFFGVTLVAGWTSLILAIVAFGTMNLLCLGILGEYVGRIYEQSKQRPIYLVSDSSAPPPERRPPA
jgi:dolichol-phosphate mannosyltransferase